MHVKLTTFKSTTVQENLKQKQITHTKKLIVTRYNYYGRILRKKSTMPGLLYTKYIIQYINGASLYTEP